MKFTETHLSGAWLIEIKRIGDARGSFARTFCSDEFAAAGIDFHVVQTNESHNLQRGTVRGLHFQEEPHGEAKVVRCTRGHVFDVIVDLRPQSPTLHQWYGVELSARSDRQLFMPAGFAHGFQVLEEDTVLQYLMGHRYVPEAAAGLRWDDPTLDIRWPLPAATEISARDAQWPLLADT